MVIISEYRKRPPNNNKRQTDNCIDTENGWRQLSNPVEVTIDALLLSMHPNGSYAGDW